MFWLVPVVNVALSCAGAFFCSKLIREYIPIFIQRKLYGNDQCKVSNDPVAEPMGVICAAVYLIVMFFFIPVPFVQWVGTESEFPYAKLLAFLSALISICTAILLGFADDMLDLRWRHKLLFPTLSSLPVLMVYYVSGNSTTISIPTIVAKTIEAVIPADFLPDPFPLCVDIHFLYYIFMGMVIVFCTNAINIYAGINGLESGQSLVIAVSVAMFNAVQLWRFIIEPWHHLFSLFFLLPFIACNGVLYYYNKYPSKVFVGDTFCYWAGMTLAVVSILGHFSKTLLLFLIPQILNFLYSIPQLFHMVPCPRHRLPKYDPVTDTVNISLAIFKEKDLKWSGRLALRVFQMVGCLHRREYDRDGEIWVEVNNLTVINLVLLYTGRINEKRLADILLIIQMLTSCLTFFVRFYLASLFYDIVN